MTQPIAADPSRDDHVDAVLAEFFQAQDRGEPVTLPDLIASHPDLEADLREFFDAAQAIEQLAGPTVAEQSRQEYWRATTKTPGIAETLVPGQTMAPTAALPHGPLPENFGRYTIRRLLGEGAMGSVYLAQDPQLDRLVALKVPKFASAEGPEMRERFFREARAAATLRSPNICPVYDVGTIDGQLYLSMAYIEGRSLAEELRGGRKLSLDEIALIIRKLAAALHKAHQLGIVHRDLKPGNVMLDADGEPVLMDFGLARRDQANDLRVTMSGVIVGSPAYMSPEQVDSDSNRVGPPSDIYSLGVVLYEMLTGQLPFKGSILSVIGQISNKNPLRPGEIRPELGGTPLEAICLRMMARQIDDRYGNMADVATALDAIVSGGSMMMPLAAARSAAPVVATVDRPRRIGRWIAAVAAAVFFLLLGSWAVFVVTDNGTLKIETKLDDVKIEVSQNGQHVAFYDLKTGSKAERLPSGNYEIKLLGDQNNVQLSPGEFTMTRGKEVVVKATLLPPNQALPDKAASAQAAEQSPDRRAAEWVVNIGATQRVAIEGITRHVAKPDELPGGDFRVTEVCLFPLQLQPNTRLNKLAGLSELHWLRLFNCQVTDEAMKDLVDLPKLSFLDVAYNPLTDESFTHVARNCPHLKSLLAYYTRLTDKGLAELAHLPELEGVQLMNTGITDVGLQSVGENTSIKQADLSGNNLTDAGLVAIAKWRNLEVLVMDGTRVTDAGLAHLAALSALQRLNLNDTAITDAGLEKLAGLKQLRELKIRGTRATAAGKARLQLALPNLSIELLPIEEEERRRLATWRGDVGAVAWTRLAPHEATANDGVVLRKQEDDSLLAEGPNPPTAEYRIVMQPTLKRISALRLDALRDDRLPGKGPGRIQNGTFVLTGVEIRIRPRVNAKEQVVKVRRVIADYSQSDHDVSQLGNGGGSWAIWRDGGAMRDQSLVLDFAEPVALDNGATLIVTLRHGSHWFQCNLGRFRLSATDADRPVAAAPAQPAHAELAGQPPQQLHRLDGHKEWVLSVAFSPDGKQLVSAGADHKVRFWDHVVGSEASSIDAHSDDIRAIAFSPDREIFATAAHDRTIKLWNAADHTLLKTLSGHSHNVTSLAFSPDGKRLVSGSDDNTARLWDVTAGTQIGEPGRHPAAVSAVAFSPDSTTIATGGKDSAIRLWSAELIKIIDLTGHADEIRSLAFSHDGKWLASGGRDGQTRLWDVPGTRLEATFGEYKGRVYGVAFSPDDTLLAAGGGDFTSGSVQLFDVANREKLHTLEGYKAFVHAVAFSPDGALLATGGGDWSVRVWRVSDGKPSMPPASAE